MKLAALLGGELRRLGAVLCALALLVGCGDKGMVVDVDLISRYHAMAFPETPTVTARTIDAFLDYSAGMGEGMRATADINDRLKNFLGGRNVTYFRVGAVAEPAPIDIASPAANFMDLKNYVDAGSRLKVALDRIVSHRDRVSLFVTDFERVEDITLKQSLPSSPPRTQLMHRPGVRTTSRSGSPLATSLISSRPSTQNQTIGSTRIAPRHTRIGSIHLSLLRAASLNLTQRSRRQWFHF